MTVQRIEDLFQYGYMLAVVIAAQWAMAAMLLKAAA